MAVIFVLPLLINIEKACKKIDKKIYKENKSKKLKSDRNSLVYHENSNPKINELLKFASTYDPCDRDSWWRFGMIVHHETNGDSVLPASQSFPY